MRGASSFPLLTTYERPDVKARHGARQRHPIARPPSPWQLALGQQYYVASLRVWAYLILTEVEHRELSLHLALHYLADRLGALVLEITVWPDRCTGRGSSVGHRTDEPSVQLPDRVDRTPRTQRPDAPCKMSIRMAAHLPRPRTHSHALFTSNTPHRVLRVQHRVGYLVKKGVNLLAIEIETSVVIGEHWDLGDDQA